ncbi:conjugal transfer protein TraX [Sodalis endosymbiont of Spalangia cameroni]|uniref:conjugal transfer protein TraX n=1 Tax=Sodalis praecaptivus TaxID=1239307 RepID=UPI0031F82E29
MKLKTGLYYLANLFVPLSEARYTTRHIVPSLFKQLRRLRVARKLLARTRGQPALSWQQAVRASGMSVMALERQQLRRKRLYLALGGFPVLCALGLLLAVLLSGLYTPVLLVRVAITLFVLLALASIPLLQALVCTWRLWQLRERRLSVQEQGTFTDFRRSTPWLRMLLCPWR